MVTSNSRVLDYALRLRGIRVRGHVGVSEAEREMPQEIVFSVDIEFAGELYPLKDELALAADYAEIVRLAEEVVRERAVRLLETLALRTARRLEERWPGAHRVRVAVTKANVPVSPRTDEATVEVTLGRAAA